LVFSWSDPEFIVGRCDNSSKGANLKSPTSTVPGMNGTMLHISAREPDSFSIENLNPGNMKKKKERTLKRVLATLGGSDTYGCFNGGHEYLTIPDISSGSRIPNDLDHTIHILL